MTTYVMLNDPVPMFGLDKGALGIMEDANDERDSRIDFGPSMPGNEALRARVPRSSFVVLSELQFMAARLQRDGYLIQEYERFFAVRDNANPAHRTVSSGYVYEPVIRAAYRYVFGDT